MEDMDLIRAKKIKKILIIFIIVIILIIPIYFSFKYFLEKSLESKLKKIGYTEIAKKIYSKNDEENNIKTGYTYNITNGNFSKTISITGDLKQETIGITKNNNDINVNYIYQDSKCQINQKGNYKKGNFKCDIESRTNNCAVKCDVILKYVKDFIKEANKI